MRLIYVQITDELAQRERELSRFQGIASGFSVNYV